MKCQTTSCIYQVLRRLILCKKNDLPFEVYRSLWASFQPVKQHKSEKIKKKELQDSIILFISTGNSTYQPENGQVDVTEEMLDTFWNSVNSDQFLIDSTMRWYLENTENQASDWN